ncbi:hypothetical protein ACFLU2_00920 [Chloroflexota bacterium]
MAALRAQPIGRLSRSQIGNILRNVHKHEGNVALKDVLKTEWIVEFARLLPPSLNSNLGNIQLKDFLSYDYRVILTQNGDLGMLKSDVSKRARVYLLEKIDGQLRRFSNILDEGGILLFAPQDDHSEDGRFVPIRSGLHRLICMAQAEVRVLPVNIDYDFMTAGRMRIHVTIGAELTNVKGLRKSGFEELLKRAITSLGVVNMGHLGSACLLGLAQDNSESVTKELLAQEVLSRAQRLRGLGLNVDDVLINSRSLGRHLDGFIKYCVRRDWLRNRKDGEFILNKEAVLDSSPTDHRGYTIRYCYNELLTCQCAIESTQDGCDSDGADNGN